MLYTYERENTCRPWYICYRVAIRVEIKQVLIQYKNTGTAPITYIFIIKSTVGTVVHNSTLTAITEMDARSKNKAGDRR